MPLRNARLDSKELQLGDDFNSLTFYGQFKLAAKIINSLISGKNLQFTACYKIYLKCRNSLLVYSDPGLVFFPARYGFGLVWQQQAGSGHF